MAAGMWPLSHQQIVHPVTGKPISALATFFRAEDATPIIPYKDYNLGVPHPNPVPTSGYGIFPVVFLDVALSFYRYRVMTSGGVVIPGFDVTTVPIIGPSGGGGGGGPPIDPNALKTTGEVMFRFDNQPFAGYVRVNGRTIGSATSGATERANADTQPLFNHLWPFTRITLVGGAKGATAAVDWAANRQLTLPNMAGRAIVAADDLGAGVQNIISAATIAAGTPTDVGSTGGTERHALVEAEIPSHRHAGPTGNQDTDHTHQVPITSFPLNYAAGVSFIAAMISGGGISTSVQSANHAHSLLTQFTGGGGLHLNMQPSMLYFIYMKL